MVARYLLKKRKQRRIHLLEFLACDSSVGRAVDCKRLKRFFFSERFQNHTLCWNHRKSYALSKAYDFGTILLFSSISTRRTTYSLIKLARKVGTVHTKIVLDYDSRRVSVSRTRRRRFFASIETKITKWFQNHTLFQKRMIFDGSNKAYAVCFWNPALFSRQQQASKKEFLDILDQKKEKRKR